MYTCSRVILLHDATTLYFFAPHHFPIGIMVRNAVITGSAQGIGKAIAEHLLQEGYNVVINDLPQKETLINKVVEEMSTGDAKGRVVGVPANAATEEGVGNLISKCVDTFGSLDVMVCNAGIFLLKPILDTSLEEFQGIVNVNLLSVWIGYRLAAQQMIKQGKGGRIIGASSTAGKTAVPTLGAYSATKFGIRALTQAAAQEWGTHGITVNAYCPGVIDTPLLQGGVSEGVSAMFGEPNKHIGDIMSERFPVGRIGIPEDIGRVVAFLASEKSSFITGQSWIIDGSTVFD